MGLPRVADPMEFRALEMMSDECCSRLWPKLAMTVGILRIFSLWQILTWTLAATLRQGVDIQVKADRCLHVATPTLSWIVWIPTKHTDFHVLTIESSGSHVFRWNALKCMIWRFHKKNDVKWKILWSSANYDLHREHQVVPSTVHGFHVCETQLLCACC